MLLMSCCLRERRIRCATICSFSPPHSPEDFRRKQKTPRAARRRRRRPFVFSESPPLPTPFLFPPPLGLASWTRRDEAKAVDQTTNFLRSPPVVVVLVVVALLVEDAVAAEVAAVVAAAVSSLSCCWMMLAEET